MKRLLLCALAGAPLALGACTNLEPFYRMQETMIKEAFALKAKDKQIEIEREKTKQEQAKSVTALKDKMDAGGAAAYAVATAISGNSSPASSGPDATAEVLKIVALQRPPKSWMEEGREWAMVLLGGFKIWADRDVNIAGIQSNQKVQESLHGLIAAMSRDAAAGNAKPAYQITVTDSENVSVGSGSATTSTPTTYTLTCSTSTGPAGAAAATGAAGTTGSSNTSGAGAPGGSPISGPVNCTVTR